MSNGVSGAVSSSDDSESVRPSALPSFLPSIFPQGARSSKAKQGLAVLRKNGQPRASAVQPGMWSPPPSSKPAL